MKELFSKGRVCDRLLLVKLVPKFLCGLLNYTIQYFTQPVPRLLLGGHFLLVYLGCLIYRVGYFLLNIYSILLDHDEV